MSHDRLCRRNIIVPCLGRLKNQTAGGMRRYHLLLTLLQYRLPAMIARALVCANSQSTMAERTDGSVECANELADWDRPWRNVRYDRQPPAWGIGPHHAKIGRSPPGRATERHLQFSLTTSRRHKTSATFGVYEFWPRLDLQGYLRTSRCVEIRPLIKLTCRRSQCLPHLQIRLPSF